MTWVNSVVQGILLGGQYALFAAGLSLMFGVMRIINLAHGDIGIFGAYLALSVSSDLGISPFLALAVITPVMVALGWSLQTFMLDRSLRAGPLVPLLTTFGLAIVIQNLLLQVYGPNVQSLGGQIGTLAYSSWEITDQLSIPKFGVLTFVVAVALLGGLQLFLSRSSPGRAMRATAEDPDTAELVGINARRVYATAAAIAVVSAALAGAFFAMRSSFDPYSGPTQLIYAFEAVVIGGFGSLWGTLIGGIVLGVAQTTGAQIDPQYSILAGNLVFLAVLVARSGGILERLGLRQRA